ncbi:hypothetical protein [Actinoplanes sp. TFC3]|uniref:hypothetical protein n=1 Tax=Actinoplanes sp. TFC3 TaxID=1710355 RepID=UPI000831396E|nr:hypothetical protein [Actinoplanes sp. TFC3]
MPDETPLDDALYAYSAGHADGAAGRPDSHRAAHPGTGADYRAGLADGSVSAFQAELLKQVRRALGDSPQDHQPG